MKKLLLTAALGLLTIFANSSSLVSANLSQTKLIGSNNTTKSLEKNETNIDTTDVGDEAALQNIFDYGGSARMVKDIEITNPLYAMGTTVTLDLNGHVLSLASGKNTNIINITTSVKTPGSLTLNDSAKTAEHKGTINSDGLWVYDGKGSDIIYGGVITGGKVTDSVQYGYAINCSGGTFVMNGGTIAGNQSTSGNCRGAVGIWGESSFTMTGGAISNNINNNFYAGGVCVNGNNTSASFKMTGGKITGNSCKYTGGGVEIINGGSFTMTDGTIANNVCIEGYDSYTGAGVAIRDGTSSFIMQGGTISGNNATSATKSCSGAGVAVAGRNCVFTMTGGKITNNESNGRYSYGAGVYCSMNLNNVTFGGSAYVQGNSCNGKTSNVYIFSNGALSRFNVGTPEPSMSIGVNVASTWAPQFDEPVKFTTTCEEGVEKYFTSDDFMYDVEYNAEDSCLQLWKPKVNTITLREDLNIGAALNFSDRDQTFTLDLNGYAIIMNGSDDAIKLNGAKLTIIDNNPTREHVGYVDANGLWHLGSGEGTPMTVKGGIITGVTGEGHAVNINNFASTFTMNGGTIIGNGSTSGGAGVKVVSGATFTMEGGTIANNTSTTGAAGVDSAGTFIMKEGSVISHNNGSIGGVNITAKTFTMEGGTIANNVSTSSGGGVKIASSSATFTMEGGTIANNTSVTSGAGVDSVGTFTMKAGAISNNTSTGSDSTGGGVSINGGSFKMIGGIISDNKVGENGNGAGLYVSTGDSVTFGGDAKITNNFCTPATLDHMNNVDCNLPVSLGEGDEAPKEGMSIGFHGDNLKIITEDDISKYFFADAEDKCVLFIEGSIVVGNIPDDNYKLRIENYDNGFVSVPEISKNGDKVVVTVEPAEGYDLASLKYKVGEQEIDITKDKSFTMPSDPVSIIATFSVKAESIAIKDQPDKTTYDRGEELDVSGATIDVKYIDGTTDNIPVTSDMVSGYDKNIVGEQKLTVTYLGLTAYFTVTVNDSPVTKVELKSAPTKTEYKVGEELDLTGAKITVTYENGNSDVIDVTSEMVSGYNKTKVGKQKVTVTYEGKETSFEVTVVKNPDPPIPPTPEDGGLSTGAIAGIAAGGAVALGGLTTLIVLLAKKKKKKGEKSTKTVSEAKTESKPVKKVKPVSKAKTTKKAKKKKK